MSLEEIIDSYVENGYSLEDARSKVSQDVILLKISNSKFSKHITIKGGVVIHNISNDIRRATRDLDIDFIRYSLDDDSIRNFIKSLNMVEDGIDIKIVGEIKPLHHQDYDGKRVNILINDNFNCIIKTKLDIGVQKSFDVEQDEYCFNLNGINKNVSLLINSKEQIFTEKVKSLLKLGLKSTRYKDLFDFYYLINMTKLDKNKLDKCFKNLIFKDKTMKENNYKDVFNRLDVTFNSITYKFNLGNPKVNWLDINSEKAIRNVLNYIKDLDREFVHN